ncbi:hypothetical protein [uncultured Alistipes sp.]|uniref:hypothetical protein n=1 Tax=uncultured Alistipes sp. TaxID=538949 RepID=UPI0026359961|nr:hypothetical protein [uncultured Alistipes sp.]
MSEQEDKMRLSLMAYPFPEVKRVEEVFSKLKADPELFEEAKRRGFFMGHTKANQMFGRLFSGGRIMIKPEADTEFVRRVIPYLKALLRSYALKHEEKEAICAMILDEIADDVMSEAKK